MTTLKEREEAFERKFAHDEETKFKIISRRNKLLGLWAAALLNKADADAYAKEVILAEFEEAGDEDVFRKLRADFDAAGVSVSDEELRTKMVDLLRDATLQINPPV
ncbi:hypothetical protein GCM10011385_07090 [Nitratireductor aestuarii]|uniref:DUF1476 domain-containing protein n=1 Tax=Nitratireductor aestuarii TaxID=1735103 RepID=A0A916RHA4_9HYPH|nr:DUF1476 domain-containing protein [Nitratireductor aestuarii]GGA56089.1 hypothetical protein GCM10011385_07090 [Nitratireductor aestuarii]